MVKREMRKWVALFVNAAATNNDTRDGSSLRRVSTRIHVDGAILIDAESGKILYEENADTATRHCKYDENDDGVYSFRSN